MPNSTFRDRCRVIRKAKGERVAGGYVKGELPPGPWIRCVYDPGDETEVRTAGGVRRRRASTVVTGRRDIDGGEVELLASDELEVDSRIHGLVRVGVVGDPERVTRGRTWTGWQVRIGKTNERASG